MVVIVNPSVKTEISLGGGVHYNPMAKFMLIKTERTRNIIWLLLIRSKIARFIFYD